MQKNTLKIRNTQLIKSEGINSFRYSLIVEYVGWGFYGSQKQRDVKTVQEELENALKKILQQEIKIVFAGRTDKGVHARNQVAHFDSSYEINTYRFLYSLNAVLSKNISVINIQKVNKNFHSQKNAKYRWYRYVINNRPQRSVWLDKTSCYIKEKLDIELMKQALKHLEGKHDFTSFKKVNTHNPAKECIMYHAEITEQSGIISIDFIADRFLYNMVRIIVGTLISIGKGMYPPEQMLKVLEAKDRTKAGATAEAGGLTLMMVGYDEKYDIKTIMETNDNENLLCKAS